MSTPHGGSHAQKQYWSWRSMVTGTVDAITFTGALAVAATLTVAAVHARSRQPHATTRPGTVAVAPHRTAACVNFRLTSGDRQSTIDA
ncbi:hypothetical protein [Actinoallomurus iriomotensis]|uniref:Uncharacterized protein n=1 Tax=Actinoallomurus iriomotensis TaxID=478107 RepID=A0A9W6RIK7_9ACTN|nr:hypothetical protein [Actinoallomurus iriomotensis]GLY74712.1 hypothetical protein Airi01_029790 [Actinoallomurus iriomotensis]